MSPVIEDDDLPDARDGLSRKERMVLVILNQLEEERKGANVPLPMLYGRVVERLDMSIGELQAIVQRLAGRRY